MSLWDGEKNSFMGEAILEMSVWVSLWEGEKNNFMGEAVLEMSVWQIKQLTTARETVVSYAKQAHRVISIASRLRKTLV